MYELFEACVHELVFMHAVCVGITSVICIEKQTSRDTYLSALMSVWVNSGLKRRVSYALAVQIPTLFAGRLGLRRHVIE